MTRRSIRTRDAAASPDPPPAEHAPSKVSFTADVRPLFEPFAAAMMWRFDLTDFEAVRANANTIQSRLGQDMPPPPFELLSSEKQALFGQWIADGCRP